MTSEQVIYVIAAFAGVLSLAAWAAWVLVPAWGAYSRLWERVLATILSVYVLAAMVLVGGVLGGAVLYFFGDL